MRKASLPFFLLVMSVTALTGTAAADVGAPVVTIAPALKQRLVQKKKLDPSKLVVTMNGQTPLLKIARGRSYQLMPVHDPSPRLPPVTALPPELVGDEASIEAWQPGIRRAAQVGVVSHLDYQTSIKDQNPRGTCVAHSNLAGLEAFIKRTENRTVDLSENHAHQIFLQGGTCTIDGGIGLAGMLQLQQHGVCSEAAFPYTQSCPTGGVPAACINERKVKLTKIFGMSFPDDPNPKYRADNTALLESLLKQGWDIEYSIKVAGSDWVDGAGVIDVQMDNYGNPAAPYGAHGILLVGYDHNAGHFVFKNSWGADWGHAGYGWLSYDYIETYARYAYAITGVGYDGGPIRTAPPVRLP